MDPVSLSLAGALITSAIALDKKQPPVDSLVEDGDKGFPNNAQDSDLYTQSHTVPDFRGSSKTYGPYHPIYTNEDGNINNIQPGIIRGRSAPENVVREDPPPQLPTEFLGITGTKDGDLLRNRLYPTPKEALHVKGFNGVEFEAGNEWVPPPNPQQAHIDSRTKIPMHTLKAHTHLEYGITSGPMDRPDLYQSRHNITEQMQQTVKIPERAVGVLENRAGPAGSENAGNSRIRSAVVATDDPYKYLQTPLLSDDPDMIQHRTPNPGMPDVAETSGKYLATTEGFTTSKFQSFMRNVIGHATKMFAGEFNAELPDVVSKEPKIEAGLENRLAGRSTSGMVSNPSTNKNDVKQENAWHAPLRGGTEYRDPNGSAAHYGKLEGEKHYMYSHHDETSYDPKQNPSGSHGEQMIDIDPYNYLHVLQNNPYHVKPTLPLGRVV